MNGESPMPNLYDLLELSADADAAAIKAAYRRLAKTAHPDAGGDAERFRLLTLAYDILSDKDKRAFYDRTGRLPDEHQAAQDQAALFAVLGELLLTVIADMKSPEREDVFALLRLRLADGIAHCDQAIGKLTLVIDRAHAVAKRIQVREGENLVRAQLDKSLAGLEAKRAALELERDRFRQITALLENYDYFLKVDSVMVSTDSWP